MMRPFKKYVTYVLLFGLLIFAGACKKTSNTPSNNNNNNTPPPNPKGPTITVVQDFPVPTTPPTAYNAGTYITFIVSSRAAKGTVLTSVKRNDGTLDTTLATFKGTTTVSDTSRTDLYLIPLSAFQGQLVITYTVTDSILDTTGLGKAKRSISNTVSETLTVVGKARIFKFYTGYVADQTNVKYGTFINSGGLLSGGTGPYIYNTGDVDNDTSNRRLVDLVVEYTGGVELIAAPSSTTLNTVTPSLNMNGWLLSQRNKTQLKLPSNFVYNNCTAATIEAAFIGDPLAATDVTKTMAVGDTYIFKCADGRWGAFQLLSQSAPGYVQINIAAESR